MDAFVTGTMILARMVACPAPSIIADSGRDSGTDAIAVLKTTRLKVFTAPGRMRAHLVPTRWSLSTTIYVGIVPPWKYMVKTIITVKNLMNIGPFLERTYAEMMVINKLRLVPTSTTKIVFM